MFEAFDVSPEDGESVLEVEVVADEHLGLALDQLIRGEVENKTNGVSYNLQVVFRKFKKVLSSLFTLLLPDLQAVAAQARSSWA